MKTVVDVACEAKAATIGMQAADCNLRNKALQRMSCALIDNRQQIMDANATDLDAARADGMSEGLLDRLALTQARIQDMADALCSLCNLPDPLGEVQRDYTLDNGLHIQRVSVPLGVVAVVYEARPNVTADAVGICIKSGNAVVLRGGSSAYNSNLTIATILAQAAHEAGLPKGCIGMVESRDRSATDELLRARDFVDVLVPRGGAGLIRHCVEYATVPVIETGTGNCHVYVAQTADLAMAERIILNAKTQRVGVCNAMESLLVDVSIASEFLPRIVRVLNDAGVVIHGDAQTVEAGASCGVEVLPATQEDWATEYLALEVSIAVIDGLDAAISHINRYGTKHSEVIVTQDDSQARTFLAAIDAAAVYVNASSRFTDGGVFGLGAEIGISTQKLHARGPFATEALTTYKYLIQGTGQVRE